MSTPMLGASYRGPGLRVRFSRIRGVTAKDVLEQPLLLPVTLGEFTVDEEFAHNEYGTISAGQFSSPTPGPPTARQLRTTDLDTLTLDWHDYARFLVNPHLSEEDARRELYAVARSKTAFELLATTQLGSSPDELRMKATIRSLSRSLRPGEADTRYYTIGISEWRDNSTERRGVGRSLPTTHSLDANDTLVSLARAYFPSEVPIKNGAQAIKKANGITRWGNNDPLVRSKRWKVGDRIKIPAAPKGTLTVAVGPTGVGGLTL